MIRADDIRGTEETRWSYGLLAACVLRFETPIRKRQQS
jgi:hypothetical protein